MTTECEYCAAARANPISGLMMRGCLGCEARHLLKQPNNGYAASLAAGKFRVDYKARLVEIAGDDWEALHRQVRAWDEARREQK